MKIIKRTLTGIALLLSTLIVGCGPSKPKLHIFTWSDYIDEELIAEFEKQYNCEVQIDTFDSNESMFSKLSAGAKGYDIITPTSYMAKLMYEKKLIEKLDLSKLENAKLVDKAYLEGLAYDKKMEYSVPYLLGYTCIAYNKNKVGDIEKSWKIFERSDLKGRMTLLDDMRETIGAGLFMIGRGMNCTDKQALQQAKEVILKWKKNLAKFDNESYKNGLASNEFFVTQGYSGDVLQIVKEQKHIDLFAPKEGVSVSCDDFVIPVSAGNKDLAYKFINFILEPKNAAKNMEYTCYFAPVPEAKKYLKDFDIEKVFPSFLYKKGEFIKDMGDENKKFIEVWEEIKKDLN